MIAVRGGATCLVGSGDGIGDRRSAGEAPETCVARDGFDVRARLTSVRFFAPFVCFLADIADARVALRLTARGRRAVDLRGLVRPARART
jgi:hypothetical protein